MSGPSVQWIKVLEAHPSSSTLIGDCPFRQVRVRTNDEPARYTERLPAPSASRIASTAPRKSSFSAVSRTATRPARVPGPIVWSGGCRPRSGYGAQRFSPFDNLGDVGRGFEELGTKLVRVQVLAGLFAWLVAVLHSAAEQVEFGKHVHHLVVVLIRRRLRGVGHRSHVPPARSSRTTMRKPPSQPSSPAFLTGVGPGVCGPPGSEPRLHVSGQSRSMMVALAVPPPSHTVCSP